MAGQGYQGPVCLPQPSSPGGCIFPAASLDLRATATSPCANSSRPQRTWLSPGSCLCGLPCRAGLTQRPREGGGPTQGCREGSG